MTDSCCPKTVGDPPYPCIFVAGHDGECEPWDPPLEGYHDECCASGGPCQRLRDTKKDLG